MILHHVVLLQRGQGRRSDEGTATSLAICIYELWLGKPHTNPTTSTRPTPPMQSHDDVKVGLCYRYEKNHLHLQILVESFHDDCEACA